MLYLIWSDLTSWQPACCWLMSEQFRVRRSLHAVGFGGGEVQQPLVEWLEELLNTEPTPNQMADPNNGFDMVRIGTPPYSLHA